MKAFLRSKEKILDYLFFDIEASEGRSMCSFGYVLTDENFNVLEKEDILINPEARFCTQARSKKKREGPDTLLVFRGKNAGPFFY